MNILSMLKIDLGITTTAYDERLTAVIKAAKALIRREGAFLDDNSPEDMQLIIMTASWLWRRRDTGEGMPRMIRYALNNRIFSEKMEG